MTVQLSGAAKFEPSPDRQHQNRVTSLVIQIGIRASVQNALCPYRIPSPARLNVTTASVRAPMCAPLVKSSSTIFRRPCSAALIKPGTPNFSLALFSIER
jgi:hypothetical protein